MFSFRIPSPKEGRPIPVGVAIIRALKDKVIKFGEENPGKLKIENEKEVVGIVTWNDYVTGVRYQNSSGYVGRCGFIYTKHKF